MEAGKIYWLLGDFKILNSDDPDYWHSVAKIEEDTWRISCELIKFHTIQTKLETTDSPSYSVELLPSKGNFYLGNAKFSDTGKNTAEIKCELFENPKKYLLKGEWIESGELYTWIAVLEKNKK